jgi:hypothetical protein
VTKKITLPVSLSKETQLLKKFQNVAEVKEELSGLIAKAIATLDWLLENGTPGTQLGAAQTVLQSFVPKAPQVVENLNYDVAALSSQQQEEIIRLGRAYRSILGSATEGRGSAGEAEGRIREAQTLFLPAPEPDPPEGPSEPSSDEGTSLEIEGENRIWRE